MTVVASMKPEPPVPWLLSPQPAARASSEEMEYFYTHLEQVLREFAEWVGEDWMCAHSAPFDARVLGYEYARTALDPPAGPLLDTLCLAKHFLPESPDHKLATLTEHLDLDVGVLADPVGDALTQPVPILRHGGRKNLNAVEGVLLQPRFARHVHLPS